MRAEKRSSSYFFVFSTESSNFDISKCSSLTLLQNGEIEEVEEEDQNVSLEDLGGVGLQPGAAVAREERRPPFDAQPTFRRHQERRQEHLQQQQRHL